MSPALRRNKKGMRVQLVTCWYGWNTKGLDNWVTHQRSVVQIDLWATMQQLPFHVHRLIHLPVYARTRYVLSTYSRLWRSERKQQSLDLLSVTLRNFPSTQHVELRAISLSKRPCVCTKNDKALPRKNNKQITAARRTIFSEKDKRNSGLRVVFIPWRN